MLVTFNKNGGKKSNGGGDAKNYLLGKDNDRENARLLKGDPDTTTQIIDSLDFAKIYTSGTLAFDYGEGDEVTEQQKLDIIESFEKTLFPDLDPNQYSGYWVEHTDKQNDLGQRRLELNFIFANVELTTAKALPVYFHKIDKGLVDNWQTVVNADYHFRDPKDPAIKKALSNHAPIHFKLEEKYRTNRELKNDIHDLVTTGVENGELKNRNDIVAMLNENGIEVVRQTEKSISIKNDSGKKNIRLKGAYYERGFKVDIGAEVSASQTEQRTRNESRIATARQELSSRIANRASRLHRRYSGTEKSVEPSFQELQREIDSRLQEARRFSVDRVRQTSEDFPRTNAGLDRTARSNRLENERVNRKPDRLSEQINSTQQSTNKQSESGNQRNQSSALVTNRRFDKSADGSDFVTRIHFDSFLDNDIISASSVQRLENISNNFGGNASGNGVDILRYEIESKAGGLLNADVSRPDFTRRTDADTEEITEDYARRIENTIDTDAEQFAEFSDFIADLTRRSRRNFARVWEDGGTRKTDEAITNESRNIATESEEYAKELSSINGKIIDIDDAITTSKSTCRTIENLIEIKSLTPEPQPIAPTPEPQPIAPMPAWTPPSPFR